MLDVTSAVDTVYSPFEVACIDLQGRETGRPVSEVLGGRVRDRVPFSGYLFYKWAGHPGPPDDEWGEALTPDQLVAQAHRMVDGWGFGSLKLKGGVLPPSEECDAIEALRDAFPDLPLRLDPNGAWTPSTRRVAVATRLAGVVEYLEDPTPGHRRDGRGLGAAPTCPLATNMCVIAHGAPPAGDRVRRRADRAVRPPPVGRPAPLAAAGRDHRDLGPGAVDAQQLAPRRLARRDDPPGRRDADPDLRLRHPLPVEDPGPHQARACCPSWTARSPCRRVRASASSSTATCSGCCTSSTSSAAYDVARTPSTCGPSSRTSRQHRPLVSAGTSCALGAPDRALPSRWSGRPGTSARWHAPTGHLRRAGTRIQEAGVRRVAGEPDRPQGGVVRRSRSPAPRA